MVRGTFVLKQLWLRNDEIIKFQMILFNEAIGIIISIDINDPHMLFENLEFGYLSSLIMWIILVSPEVMHLLTSLLFIQLII